MFHFHLRTQPLLNLFTQIKVPFNLRVFALRRITCCVTHFSVVGTQHWGTIKLTVRLNTTKNGFTVKSHFTEILTTGWEKHDSRHLRNIHPPQVISICMWKSKDLLSMWNIMNYLQPFSHFLLFLYVQTWVFKHSCNVFTEETKQLILKCKDVISLNHVTVISLSNNLHQQASPGKCRPACGERWEVTVQIFEHFQSDLSSSSLLF